MNFLELEKSWATLLDAERSKPYFASLQKFIEQREKTGAKIFPPRDDIFAAFRHTPVEKVKVVILGQDPYHGIGQAHGLCFSVQSGSKIPPSLRNIFKELKSDVGVVSQQSGDLTPWTKQGVLLLNSVLTVEEGAPGAHAKKGWEEFTDRIIHELSKKDGNLVFILWGAYAQGKAGLIDGDRHCVIRSVHPSPLSASRGFFGSRPFSSTNAWLISRGKAPVNWSLQ